MRYIFRGAALAAVLVTVNGCAPEPASTEYDDLVQLFDEWRAFEAPRITGGVPDYTAAAMNVQRQELAVYRQRLAAIDPSEWPVAQQIDYQIVQAEMSGLDFDHRIRRPWANNPAFYVMIFPAESDVPAHEGPVIHTWIDLWTYEYPLSAADASELADRIGTVPAVLEQAKGNLVGTGRDMWAMGIRSAENQRTDLEAFAERVAGTSADLDAAIASATEATAEFRTWLQSELPRKTEPSGVGKANYTWYLNNVHLVPFTWEEEVTLMRRELARAHASLLLEEHRNRDLPPLRRVASAEEYDRAFNDAVTEFMQFLGREDIIDVMDYMDPRLRAKIGSFTPTDGLRGFFSEVAYRDPRTLRVHGYHWIDLARMESAPHPSPMRRVPSLYNIFDGRSEGLATGMEEMMMHAGLFDDSPRSRELVWILLAQRAARALGGLYMHANEWTMQEAVDFASRWTPRGWLPEDGATVWFEQHLYLQQPGYGTSYLIGKIEIERLMAERALQLGDAFTMKAFMEDFHASGVIPVSLVRWELVGERDPILR